MRPGPPEGGNRAVEVGAFLIDWLTSVDTATRPVAHPARSKHRGIG